MKKAQLLAFCKHSQKRSNHNENEQRGYKTNSAFLSVLQLLDKKVQTVLYHQFAPVPVQDLTLESSVAKIHTKITLISYKKSLCSSFFASSSSFISGQKTHGSPSDQHCNWSAAFLYTCSAPVHRRSSMSYFTMCFKQPVRSSISNAYRFFQNEK